MLWAGSRAPRAVQAAALGNIIYYFKQTNKTKNWALSRGAVCGPVAHQHALQHARSLRGYGLRGAAAARDAAEMARARTNKAPFYLLRAVDLPTSRTTTTARGVLSAVRALRQSTRYGLATGRQHGQVE